MKFLEDVSWEKVFEGWREREEKDPAWIQCATEVKGWPSWETWRRFSAAQLGASQLQWKRYLVENPMDELPALRVGPFQGWQNRLKGKNPATFAELMADPTEREFWSAHEKIFSIMNRFPGPTELIVVHRADDGGLVNIEGHHRSAAVALAAALGNSVLFPGQVTFALATLPLEQVGVLDEMLKRGSHRLDT